MILILTWGKEDHDSFFPCVSIVQDKNEIISSSTSHAVGYNVIYTATASQSLFQSAMKSKVLCLLYTLTHFEIKVSLLSCSLHTLCMILFLFIMDIVMFWIVSCHSKSSIVCCMMWLSLISINVAVCHHLEIQRQKWTPQKTFY